MTIALSAPAWGQTAPLDKFPTPEEVQPLRDEAVTVLGAIFEDPDTLESDHTNAVFVLQRADSPAAVPLLISILENDPFASVRREAARELGALRAGSSLPSLRAALETETLASLRWVIGMSILQMRPGDSDLLDELMSDVDLLAEAALALQDPDVATEFPVALRPRLVEAFMEALPDRDNYNSVERAAIMQTLAAFGVTESTDLIVSVMNDLTEESFVRGSAAFVLGELGAMEALPDLLSNVETGDPGIQLGAVSAFGALKDPMALEALITLVNQPDASPSVRIGAASSLAFYDESGLDALIENVNNDPIPDVRAEAVRSILAIGTDEARQAIVDFFTTDFLPTCDPFACATLALEAMYALAQFDEGDLAFQLLESSLAQLEAFLPFVFAFQEADLVRVTTEVARVNPAVFDLLLPSENPYVQNLGIAAFAAVYGRDARDFLIAQITPDNNRLARRAALEGLLKIAVADDVEIFSEWVLDGDRRSRLASFTALAQVGDVRAFDVIRDPLFVDDMSIQLQAADAAFAYANGIDELFEAVDEFDPDVVSAAVSDADPADFD